MSSSSACAVLPDNLDDEDCVNAKEIYARRVLEVGVAGDVEEDAGDDDLDDEDCASRRCVSRVDAIISQVTCEYADAAASEAIATEDEATPYCSRHGSLHPNASSPFGGAGAAVASPSGAGSFVGGGAVSRKVPRAHGGQTRRGGGNAARLAEIAQILAAPKKSAPEVREYVAGNDFGRVPRYLQNVTLELDEEQEYIISLHERPREEAPKVFVRLLTQGEKEELVLGLKQRFQFATARYLKERPKGRSKDALEAELGKIKQDIESLSRPYIFVRDEDADQ